MRLTKNWELIWPIQRMTEIELDIGQELLNQIKEQIRKEIKEELK